MLSHQSLIKFPLGFLWLTEAEFLDFEPFVVAVTTICCALEEVLPVQADHLKILIINYIPLDVV